MEEFKLSARDKRVLKNFQKKIEILKNKELDLMRKMVEIDEKTIETIAFTKFDCDNNYYGDKNNVIFLTYNDHYRGNSATRQSVGELHNPCIWGDDRGYLRGIALDLCNFVKLRKIFFKKEVKASDFIHNYLFSNPFLKSRKNKDFKIKLANDLLLRARHECLLRYQDYFKSLNICLKNKTGISALYYLESI